MIGFELFSRIPTELSDLRSPFNPFENGFFANTAYAVSGLIMKIIKIYTYKEKGITIMTAKEWNKAKNTFRKVYRNMRAAHPNWSNAKVYMATKGQLNK